MAGLYRRAMDYLYLLCVLVGGIALRRDTGSTCT
jgi:hypothetical protein